MTGSSTGMLKGIPYKYLNEFVYIDPPNWWSVGKGTYLGSPFERSRIYEFFKLDDYLTKILVLLGPLYGKKSAGRIFYTWIYLSGFYSNDN